MHLELLTLEPCTHLFPAGVYAVGQIARGDVDEMLGVQVPLVVRGEGGEGAAGRGRRQEAERVAAAGAGGPQQGRAGGTGRLRGELGAVDPVEGIVDGAAWCAVAAHRLLVEVEVVQILRMIEGADRFFQENSGRGWSLWMFATATHV